MIVMTTFADPCTQTALYGATDDRPDGAEWATPKDFFDKLDKEFHFTLDAAASDLNHKCKKYFTKEQDGLKEDWTGETVWCNPPYGKEIGKWMAKGKLEAEQNGVTSVFLVHSRTDTIWFHSHVYKVASEIRFAKGRLKFTHADGKFQSAPFPSMVVVYRPTIQ
jgi:phage N-6-adenine-methyltransferase